MPVGSRSNWQAWFGGLTSDPQNPDPRPRQQHTAPQQTTQYHPIRSDADQFSVPRGNGVQHPLWKQKFDWLSEQQWERPRAMANQHPLPPGFSTSFSRPTPSVSLSGSSFHIDLRGEWVKQKGQPLNAVHTLPWVYYFPSSLLFFCSFFHNCLPHILWSLLIWVLSTLRWHGCSWAQTTNGDTCFIEWPQPT